VNPLSMKVWNDTGTMLVTQKKNEREKPITSSSDALCRLSACVHRAVAQGPTSIGSHADLCMLYTACFNVETLILLEVSLQ
jgi:hypothetical protein